MSMDGVSQSANARAAEMIQDTKADLKEAKVANRETSQDSAAFAANTGQLQKYGAGARTERSLKEKIKRQRVNRKADTGQKAAKCKVTTSKLQNDVLSNFKHPELSRDVLQDMFDKLNDDMDEDDIAELVDSYFGNDPYLAEDVFAFLELATEVEGMPDNKLNRAIINAHSKHAEENASEIARGQRMTTEARSFADKGLDSPSALRQWYNEVTIAGGRGGKGELSTVELFKKMMDHFGYEKSMQATNFYLKAFGADLRRGGIDMEPAEVADKMSQIKQLQSVVNVFRMARARCRIIQSMAGVNPSGRQ